MVTAAQQARVRPALERSANLFSQSRFMITKDNELSETIDRGAWANHEIIVSCSPGNAQAALKSSGIVKDFLEISAETLQKYGELVIMPWQPDKFLFRSHLRFRPQLLVALRNIARFNAEISKTNSNQQNLDGTKFCAS